jgi:hypothetical protein
LHSEKFILTGKQIGEGKNKEAHEEVESLVVWTKVLAVDMKKSGEIRET